MASPKLLLGGLVGVGSVSTAAVVAHQQGFFPSFSKQTQSSGDTASAETPSPSEARQDAVVDEKPNQTKVEKWLTDNGGAGKWEIKIKKDSQQESKDFKDSSSITDNDLDGLPKYLNTEENKTLLRSIFSALETKSLTFEKTGSDWKHSLTKEEINEWIKTKSKTPHKATLKLFVEEEKTLSDIKDKADLQKLFDCLKRNESKFSNLKSNANLIFKKISNEWKHIQKFIEDWVSGKSGRSDALKTKSGDEEKNLSDWSDDDLKTLFDCIKNYEKLFATLKTDNSEPKSVLEFKKDGDIWKLISSQKTIEIWVKATSGGKATLKLWEGDKKKVLSTISDAGEWEKIFNCLEKNTENKKLFSDLVNGNNKTLVFEKVENEWKHIKKALNNWMSTNAADKFTIQIKKSEDTTTIDTAEDDDLTGLLNHLKTEGSSYTSEASKPIILQKKTDDTNGWEQVTGGA